LEYRSKPCIFLGYNYASYKCLDTVTNKVYLTRHVIFNEDFFPAKDKATSQLPSKISAQGDAPFILPIQLPFVPHNFSGLPPVSDHTTAPSASSQPVAKLTSEIPNPSLPPISPHPMVTRTRNNVSRPKNFANGTIWYPLPRAFLAESSQMDLEPTCYSSAIKDANLGKQ